MSRKYKIKDHDKLYFVSFATVYWIDVFTRNLYREELLESLRFCQKEKGLEIYAWCIMPNHVHLIVGSQQNPLEGIIRDFKAFTSRRLRSIIAENEQESRREWILWMMERAGRRNANNHDWQFWQQNNQPVELSNSEMTQQKLEYLHNNPVEAGFVDDPAAWLYSSVRDYNGGKGLLAIQVLS